MQNFFSVEVGPPNNHSAAFVGRFANYVSALTKVFCPLLKKGWKIWCYDAEIKFTLMSWQTGPLGEFTSIFESKASRKYLKRPRLVTAGYDGHRVNGLIRGCMLWLQAYNPRLNLCRLPAEVTSQIPCRSTGRRSSKLANLSSSSAQRTSNKVTRSGTRDVIRVLTPSSI